MLLLEYFDIYLVGKYCFIIASTHVAEIVIALLTIEALFFSVFITSRTTILHSSYAADANLHSHTLQADKACQRCNYSDHDTFRRIAIEWYRASDTFRHEAKSRTISAILFGLSLLLLLPITLKPVQPLSFPIIFWISVILLLAGFLNFLVNIFANLKSCSYYRNLLKKSFCEKLIGGDRWHEIKITINTHCWLQNGLKQLEDDAQRAKKCKHGSKLKRISLLSKRRKKS